MCLVGATYLFEDNRKGPGEGVAGVGGEGWEGRFLPGCWEKRCGRLLKSVPGRAPGPRGKGAFLARRSLGVAGWGVALSGGTREPQRGGLCRTFCLCCVRCLTSCPFSQAWGRERFQLAHSFKVCPDCRDREAVGPRTHSAGCNCFTSSLSWRRWEGHRGTLPTAGQPPARLREDL